MKILVIRFSSIGDIVLTSPVVRALKSHPDQHEVHFVTKPEYASLLDSNPYIDQLHLLGGSIMSLARTLRKEKFDYVIDLHHNLRTAILKTALGVRSSSFQKLNVRKWLKVNFKLDVLPNRHVVDRYLDTLKQLGIRGDSLGLDFFIPEKDEVELSWLPAGFDEGYVAVVIGARHFTKRLPTDRLIELCDRINRPIVLLGGPEDTAEGDKIAAFFHRPNGHDETEQKLNDKLGKKAIAFNGCGKFSLNQSASLVKQSIAVFTHDTGLMHIAAAFKKQIYSIWGNTIPAFGMYPYRTKFVIFENNKIGCRPCSKIGYNNCPKGHFKCMKDQVFDFYIPD